MRAIRLVLITMVVLLCLSLQTAVITANASSYRLAYLSYNDNQIWTINPDGTDAKQISHDDQEFKQGLVASPDGKYLAYYVQSFYDSAKYLMYQVVVVLDMVTGQQKMITRQEAITGLAWSPDSQQLLFAIVTHNTDATTRYEFDVINRDGSGRTKIAGMVGYVLGPSWSPDGKQFLFSRQNAESGYQIFVMDGDGSSLYEVTHVDSCFICDRPRWTPDSQHIVFYRHPDLYIVDADGQHLRQLTDFTKVYNVIDVAYARYGPPSYSLTEDSQTLYYTMGYPLQIVKLDLAADGWTKRTVLYDDQTHIIGGNLLSPDGKFIFFSADSSQGSLLSSLNVDTYEVHTLATNVSEPVIVSAS